MSSRRHAAAAAASPRAAVPTAYVLAPAWAPAAPAPQPALSYPAAYSWYPQPQPTVTSAPPAALMHRVDARWAQTWGAWLPQAAHHTQPQQQAHAYATYGVPTASAHAPHATARYGGGGAASPTRSPFGPAPPLAPAPAHPHAAAARPAAPAKRRSHDSGHGTSLSLSLSPPPLLPRAAPSSLPGTFAEDDDDDGLAELLRGCSMPPLLATTSPRPVTPPAPVIDASAVATAALASLDVAGLDAGTVAALAALDADVDAAVLAGWWAAVTGAGLDPAAAACPAAPAAAPVVVAAAEVEPTVSVVPPPWRPTSGRDARRRAFPSIRAALAAVSVPTAVAGTKRKREVDDEFDELLRSVVPPPLRRAPMTARPVGRSV